MAYTDEDMDDTFRAILKLGFIFGLIICAYGILLKLGIAPPIPEVEQSNRQPHPNLYQFENNAFYNPNEDGPLEEEMEDL